MFYLNLKLYHREVIFYVYCNVDIYVAYEILRFRVLCYSCEYQNDPYTSYLIQVYKFYPRALRTKSF